MLIEISQIRRDGGTQLRLRTDLATLERYKDVLSDPDDPTPPEQRLAPVTVFHDGTDYWLADGYHTLQAAEAAGLTQFMAVVFSGDRRDAMIYAASANSQHGLPRSKADKYNAVGAVLREFPGATDEWISRTCRVRVDTVKGFRQALRAPVPVPEPEPTVARGTPTRPTAAERLAGLSEAEKIKAIQAEEETEAERTIACATCGGSGVCKCKGTGKCTRCKGKGEVVR